MVLLYRKRQSKSTHAFYQERGALPPKDERGKRGNLSTPKERKKITFVNNFRPRVGKKRGLYEEVHTYHLGF